MMISQLVLHIPHSSLFIPAGIRRRFLVGEQEIHENLLALTDWKTDELFAPGFTHRRVVYSFSRMVCDPERYRDDAEETMSRRGMGAVYLRDAFGRPLREATPEEREALLRRCYDPHHRLLEAAVDAAIREHGCCLIIDAHSFSAAPLPYEPDQHTDRPDICLGTCPEHTPEPIFELASEHFRERGFSVARNHPYAGTIVPLKYWGDRRVASLMIEVNRKLYMEAGQMKKSSGFDAVKTAVGKFLELVVRIGQ
jgi:N-formylglutamate amidohydrolase